MLDEYLQQLREEGELDSTGVITLDPAKALEKLGQHRVLDAAAGLLAVVGAALLAGSQQVRVESDASRLQIWSSQALDLRDLFAELFSSGRREEARELALALNSLYPKYFSAIQAVTLRDGAWLEFRQDSWGGQPVGAPPDWLQGFTQRIVLVRPSFWKQPWARLKERWKGPEDVRLLRMRTRWSPVPIAFAGGSSWELEPVDFPPGAWVALEMQSAQPLLQVAPYRDQPEDLFCSRPAFTGRSSLRGLLTGGRERESTVLVCYRGLTLCRFTFRNAMLPLQGVVNTEMLDLDASRQKIVRNHRLATLTGQLRNWIAQALVDWLHWMQGQDVWPEVGRRLLDMLPHLGDKKRDRQVFEALKTLPLLAVGERVLSITEADELVTTFGGLHVTRDKAKCRWLHDRPIVPLSDPDWRNLRFKMGWPLVYVDSFLSSVPQPDPPPEKPFYVLESADWRAVLTAWRSAELHLYRCGEWFTTSQKPLFPDFPQTIHVLLDGSFSDSFVDAEPRLRAELCQRIREECVEIMRSEGANQAQLRLLLSLCPDPSQLPAEIRARVTE